MNKNILIQIDIDTFSLYTIDIAYKISTSIGGRLNIMFLKFDDDKRLDEVKFIEDELKKINDIYEVDHYWTETISNSNFKTIKAEISELNISQIVMTNYKGTWFEELFRGSLSNMMTHEFPEQDLLLISPKNAYQFERDDYHNGKLAWLIKEDTDLTLSFKPSKEGIKGLYFKDKTTDFEHGIFLESIKEKRNEYVIFKVSDKKVVQKKI